MEVRKEKYTYMFLKLYNIFFQLLLKKIVSFFFEPRESHNAEKKPADLKVPELERELLLDSRLLQAYKKSWNRDFISLCDRVTACNKECRKTDYCPTTILSFITRNPHIVQEIQKLNQALVQLENYRERKLDIISSDLLHEIDGIVSMQRQYITDLNRNFDGIMKLHKENMLGNQVCFLMFSKKKPSQWREVVYPPVKNYGITAEAIINFILYHLFW